MLARATAATPWGIDALPVHVEVDCRFGLPQTQIVGLPDTAVRESRDRVRAAVKNCGFKLEPRAVTINLAPADLRKEGSHLDLAIALALLVAHEALPASILESRLLCGELGLDGALRPVRGALALADLAASQGLRELVLPRANAAEAAALDGPPVIGVDSLAEAIDHLTGISPVESARRPSSLFSLDPQAPDLAEVRGQELAKRALEIAAAGGHNLLLIGPPGTGKTMLARRLPGLLPPLSLSEAIAVTKVHSAAGGRSLGGLVTERPFRSPHSSVSTAGLIGGGSVPRPGEVSMAHGGVLFLDELPEFRREALESLRQPLESGEVSIVRARARMTFPARFTLLAAMNPCPCGHLGNQRRGCRCPEPMVDRYRARVSGPLLDRIDLHVEVPSVKLSEMRGRIGEPSSIVAARVAAARERQRFRFPRDEVSPVNANLGPDAVRQHAALDATAQKLLDTAYERLGLSMRAVMRILRVARTIADLAGAERVESPHLAEAIQYRALGEGRPRISGTGS